MAFLCRVFCIGASVDGDRATGKKKREQELALKTTKGRMEE